MGAVIANMSMSLDGYVEDRDGSVPEMFAWLTPGGDTVEMPGDEREFRTDGASAEQLREAAAGDRRVAVASADITRQCLVLGLLDGIAVDLVPVLLGGGTPFFGGLSAAPVHLATPTVIEGRGVTHTYYDVRAGS